MPRDIIPDVYIDSPIVTLLRDAQARIQRGWVQRYAVLPRGGGRLTFCAGGALAFDDHGRALVGKPAQGIAHCVLLLAIQKLTREDRGMTVVKFNDWWVRSQADIVQAYEVAIELRIRREQGLPV